MTAARLAEGGVRELSRRPPEILLLGASVSQEVKCFSVGQRRMSVPISATICSAACGPMAVDLAQVGAAGESMQRGADVEGGRMLLECLLRRGADSGAEGGGCCAASLASNSSMAVSHSAICWRWNS